jgi:hypothetical protein
MQADNSKLDNICKMYKLLNEHKIFLSKVVLFLARSLFLELLRINIKHYYPGGESGDSPSEEPRFQYIGQYIRRQRVWSGNLFCGYSAGWSMKKFSSDLFRCLWMKKFCPENSSV